MATLSHDELIERLGQLVDTADNYHAGSLLPVRAEIHVEGLRHGMKTIAAELRSIIVSLGGDDQQEMSES